MINLNKLQFHEPCFEEKVRETLNIFDRDLVLADLKELTELDCSEFVMLRNDYAILAECTALRTLYLEAWPDILPVIGAMTQLQELQMTCLEFRYNFDLRTLAGLRNLETLFLSGGDWSVMNFLHIEALSELQHLRSLGFHEFGSADLFPLTELPHLDTFFCGWGKDVEHIETVVQLPNLKRLSLIDAEVESMDFLDELDENVFVELCGIRTSREYDIRKLKRFRQRDISELIIAGKEYWLWKEEP